MPAPLHRRLAATAAVLFFGLAAVAVAANAPAAPPKETGDQWEVTSQVSMEGLPMALPANTSKICAPREWKEPPVAANEHQKCTNSDFKREGAKVTWKTVCTGEMAMTGEGEITRQGDSYTGSIKFTSADGTMTTKLSGKKLGACEVPAK